MKFSPGPARFWRPDRSRWVRFRCSGRFRIRWSWPEIRFPVEIRSPVETEKKNPARRGWKGRKIRVRGPVETSWRTTVWRKCRTTSFFYRRSYQTLHLYLFQGILKGEVSLYHWPPVWLVWNQLHDNRQFLFYLQNRLNQTSHTGGQRYSDTSPFRIPCLLYPVNLIFKLSRNRFRIRDVFV